MNYKTPLITVNKTSDMFQLIFRARLNLVFKVHEYDTFMIRVTEICLKLAVNSSQVNILIKYPREICQPVTKVYVSHKNGGMELCWEFFLHASFFRAYSLQKKSLR